MQHYLLDIGLDICLSIYGKLFAKVKDLTATESVDEDSENHASVDILFFEPQRNWAGSSINSTNAIFPTSIYAPYAEQVRRQSNEITAQAMSVFDTSNQLAINAINAARENVKLYGKAMDALTTFNKNVANAWSSFFSSEQRHQYFA